MTIPEVLRNVAVDVLYDRLLSVRESTATDGSQDDGFRKGRKCGLVDGSDDFGQEPHLYTLTALKLLFWSRETSGDLVCIS